MREHLQLVSFIKLLKVTACCVALAGNTAFACDLVTSSMSMDPLIEYNVYAFDEAVESVPVQLHNYGATSCDLILKMVDQADTPAPFLMGNSGLHIAVDLPGNGPSSVGGATNATGESQLTLAAGEDVNLSIDFRAPQNWNVSAGSYTHQLTFQILSTPSRAVLYEGIGQLTLVSLPRAQVNIAGTDGNFDKDTYLDTISFMDPETGDTRQVYLQSRANTANTVTIRSRNNSRMINPERPESAIHYNAYINGQLIDLSAPVSLTGRPQTDLDGVSEPMTIEIAELDNVFAGDYSDLITIDIYAD